jgi:hypothetical protein
VPPEQTSVKKAISEQTTHTTVELMHATFSTSSEEEEEGHE